MKNRSMITVAGSFGDRKMDRQDFIKQWEDHMQQLSRLSWNHAEEFQAMQNRVSEIAGEEFDRMLEIQS